MSALSGTSLTVTTLTTAGLLTNNTSGQVSSVTGSTLAALLGGAPTFTGLTLSGLATGLLKVTAGVISLASVADYQTALTVGTNITITSGTIATTTTPTFTSLTISGLASGMLKVTAGVVSLATANTDYQAALTPGTNITIVSNTLSVINGPTFTSLTLGSLSGVLSAVAGLVSNVNLSGSLTFTSGTNTLATIQDIRTTASVQFLALTLGSLGTGVLKVTSGVVGVAVAGTDYAASTGTNQLFGAGTLPALTSGTNNIAIGSAAGAVLTTGTYNVYIGANSRASGINVTGEIVIGANATAANVTGKGSNTAFIFATSGLYSYTPYCINLWNNNAATVSQVEQWVLNNTANSGLTNIGTTPTITSGVLTNIPVGVYNISISGAVYGSSGQTFYPTLQYKASGGSFVSVAISMCSFPGAWQCPFSFNAYIRISNVSDAIQLWYNTSNPYGNTGSVPIIYFGTYLPRYMTIIFISI
jgi:hypothetical protein